LSAASAIAGDLKVTWQPNTEPDLAGYFIYYGTKARPQANRIDVGRQTQYLIQNLQPGETYYIGVTAVDQAGNESALSEQVAARVLTEQEQRGAVPRQHYLIQNHPNPFHIVSQKTTTIAFELFEASHVKLEIFDLLGQRLITLANKNFNSGTQKISWNGRDARNLPVQTGIYWYRLETDREISTRKLAVYH
jgi:hypothetical protein